MSDSDTPAEAVERTVTLKLWRGRRERYGSPDETIDLPLNADGTHRQAADRVSLCDDISTRGWLGFDVDDLPEGVDEVTLYVHSSDAYHDAESKALDSRAVERGLVYDDSDPKPGVDPFVCRLEGVVVAYAEVGSRV